MTHTPLGTTSREYSFFLGHFSLMVLLLVVLHSILALFPHWQDGLSQFLWEQQGDCSALSHDDDDDGDR